VPVGLRSWYPTLRQKEGEGWGTHFCGWKRTGCGRSWFVVSQRRPDARRKTKVGPSAPLKSASLGMTVLGGRSEKQPRVLRLLAALVAQDDSSLGVRREKQPRALRLLAALVAQDDSSLGVRREKQPQVLRLLAALVAQDDSSLGVRREKQPQVLRLLAALVAQDDSSLGVRREKQPQVLRLLAALVAQDNSLIFDADDSSMGAKRKATTGPSIPSLRAAQGRRSG
jgi:hypothetical protein